MRKGNRNTIQSEGGVRNNNKVKLGEVAPALTLLLVTNIIAAACGDTAPVTPASVFNGTVGNPFQKTAEQTTQKPDQVVNVGSSNNFTTAGNTSKPVPTTPTPGSGGFFSKTLETSTQALPTSKLAVNKEATPNPNLKEITPNLDLLFLGNVDPTTNKRPVLRAKVFSISPDFIEIIFAGDTTKYKYGKGTSKIYGDVLWNLGNPNVLQVFDNATKVNILDGNSPVNVISPAVITGPDYQDHTIDVRSLGGANRNPRKGKRKGYFPKPKFGNTK